MVKPWFYHGFQTLIYKATELNNGFTMFTKNMVMHPSLNHGFILQCMGKKPTMVYYGFKKNHGNTTTILNEGSTMVFKQE